MGNPALFLHIKNPLKAALSRGFTGGGRGIRTHGTQRVQLISSQSRYDHFDSPPYSVAALGKRLILYYPFLCGLSIACWQNLALYGLFLGHEEASDDEDAVDDGGKFLAVQSFADPAADREGKGDGGQADEHQEEHFWRQIADAEVFDGDEAVGGQPDGKQGGGEAVFIFEDGGGIDDDEGAAAGEGALEDAA